MQTVYPQVQTKQKGPLSLHDIKHGILPRVGPSKPGRRFWQLMAGFLVVDSIVLVIVVFSVQIEQMASVWAQRVPFPPSIRDRNAKIFANSPHSLLEIRVDPQTVVSKLTRPRQRGDDHLSSPDTGIRTVVRNRGSSVWGYQITRSSHLNTGIRRVLRNRSSSV